MAHRLREAYTAGGGLLLEGGGDAKTGIWASGESGLLWFFNRGNAEVLVKVLNGCVHNGYRWGVRGSGYDPGVQSPRHRPRRSGLDARQSTGDDGIYEERHPRFPVPVRQ